MKRLDTKYKVDGKIRTINVLPRKLVPNEMEPSLWDTIWRYWADPMGDREPTEDELPTEYELSILDSTLTSDQTHTLRTMVESGLLEQPDEEDLALGVDQDKLATIIDMHKDGKALPIIAKAVELPVVEVQRYLNALPTSDTLDVEFKKEA